MTPPRPTMTAEDVRKLREFFDSPAGRRMMGQINRAYDLRPITDEQPEASWRATSTGERLDTEAASADPLDPSRPFPAPRLPKPVDDQATLWPLILAVILSTLACASLIAWFVSAALKVHA